MDRNTEQHFATVPHVEKPRSTFEMSQNIRTTFNAGQLIPFYIDNDILPGDTMKYNFTCVIRQSTPIYPTMDNTYADVYFFYVPWRNVWEHTKEFFGENTTGAWVQTTEYTIPKMTTPTGGAAKGTIMDYMGIPQGVAGLDFCALPLRAYVFTYNEWFRDQNLIAPATQYIDDTDRIASNTTTILGGKPFKVARFHSYFSSALPAPQKSPTGAITTPIGISAPIVGNGKAIGLTNGTNEMLIRRSSSDNGLATGGYVNSNLPFTNTTASGLGANQVVGLTTNSENSGMYADLSNAVAATINAQRYAFALQRIYESEARHGSRFREQCLGIFGVSISDKTVQIPQYIGGKRIPISMQQVAQTSSTDSVSPQGNVSAFSLTVDTDEMFTKSFEEWGTILGLICIRQDHSFSQGLSRQWSRRRRFDIYHPQLAYLGEQEIKNKEIFATGTSTDDEVFGYQERWAEYRYKNNINTGAFSSAYNLSLDSWHYGDDYSQLPVLSQEWLEETDAYIYRTLANQEEDQYLMDCNIQISATRVMPLFSVPGLMDHY